MISLLKRYGLALGAITGSVALMSGVIQFSVWAADQRYVRQEALAVEFDRQRLQTISDRIDELDLKVRLGQATILDKARLEQLIRKREEELRK